MILLKPRRIQTHSLGKNGRLAHILLEYLDIDTFTKSTCILTLILMSKYPKIGAYCSMELRSIQQFIDRKSVV